MKRLGILTGGGDCPGLNAVIRIVVKAAHRDYGAETVGFLDAFAGLVQNRHRVLSVGDVSGLASVGGTILGTSNKADPFNHPIVRNGKTVREDLSDQAIANFRKLELDALVVVGGDGTQRTALRLVEDGAKVIGVPKTIDNDLMVNDHTPGFPSAAKFVASAFAGVNQDNAALKGVYVGVVMGRHAGFLTAAAAGAKVYGDDGPHLIYLPERTFNMNNFVKDVKRVYNKLGRCVIAVSEGIHDKKGTPIVTKMAKSVEKDAHGNIQLSGTGALADVLCDEIKAK
ncbi:MAG: 6-phosphofructokinase, partial [Candidatus Krumholzibacteria bacterium]|nr:6-phosphofructokinase [Candidatus Krumholzibacteria bacterium]